MLWSGDASLALQQRYSYCEVTRGHLQAKKGIRLTLVECTGDSGDNDLKSQEGAHAPQY